MESLELKNIILEYLKSHNCLSLATVKNEIPHAASVFYVNVGFTLYFLSNPSSRHCENISYNSKVSCTINEDYSNWPSIKGLQFEGNVKEIGGILNNTKIAGAYAKKYKAVENFLFAPHLLGPEIVKKVTGVKFYTMKPLKIYFINNESGFGQRYEFTVVD